MNGVDVPYTPAPSPMVENAKKGNKTVSVAGSIIRAIGLVGVVGMLCIASSQGEWAIIYLAGTAHIWIPALIMVIVGHLIARIWKPSN